MRRLSGPTAARAKHAAGAIVRRPLPAIAILAMALMLVKAMPAEAGEAERGCLQGEQPFELPDRLANAGHSKR